MHLANSEYYQSVMFDAAYTFSVHLKVVLPALELFRGHACRREIMMLLIHFRGRETFSEIKKQPFDKGPVVGKLTVSQKTGIGILVKH